MFEFDFGSLRKLNSLLFAKPTDEWVDLPSKVSWMAEMLAEDKGMSISNAVIQIYQSDVYKRLENESSKLWHWGTSRFIS